MINQVVLAVGHGSRTAQAIAQFQQFAADLSRRSERPVSACFLELADPDMATGLVRAATEAGEGGKVTVVPAFLGAAGHQKNDVAASLHWARTQFPGVRFRQAAPLGLHANLVELLDLRVREALAADSERLPLEETGLVVVGRGSSDPGANSEIARLAYLMGEGRPYLSAEYAFQAVARPTLEDALIRCRKLGARQVLVAPFLLFAGRVYDDILAVTSEAGSRLGLRVLAASYLGVHPLLIEVAAQRLQDAILDRTTMSCDLCKYRFTMAGHEVEVGLAQTTHHLHGGSVHAEEHGHGHAHV